MTPILVTDPTELAGCSHTARTVAGTDRRAAAGPIPASPRSARPRLPLALARALGADCANCRGYGCVTCGDTGLS